jgi:RecJ-like exonuclease
MKECTECEGYGKIWDTLVVDTDEFGQDIVDDFEIECDVCKGKGRIE